jgi:endo-1,3-1,4-beta-glycanase ExoK
MTPLNLQIGHSNTGRGPFAAAYGHSGEQSARVRRRARTALRLAGCVAGLLASSAAFAQTTEPSFVDKFTGFSVKRWQISDGWSNGGTFDCSWKASAVRLTNGGIALSLIEKGAAAGGGYICGEVQSRQKYRFGVFEARFKPAEGSGINTGFSLFAPATKDHGQQEINAGVLGKDATGGFVDVGFVWTEKQLSWYENGVLVKQIKAGEGEIPQDPMMIIFSTYNRSEPWMGPFLPTTLPATAVFQRIAYTAPGDPCQFPESLVCTQKLTLSSR